MIIPIALFLQAATPAAVARPVTTPAAPRPAPVETTRPIDPAAAIALFKAVCWDSFRDPATFHAAVSASPVVLTPAPPAAADPAQPGELFRSDEAVLSYVASDTLPASIPPRQCSLRVRLTGAGDQLGLAARIGAALAIPTGRTRTGPSLSITTWDVVGADLRTTRLLAISRNGRAGGTELRLSALLLAAK